MTSFLPFVFDCLVPDNSTYVIYSRGTLLEVMIVWMLRTNFLGLRRIYSMDSNCVTVADDNVRIMRG